MKRNPPVRPVQEEEREEEVGEEEKEEREKRKEREERELWKWPSRHHQLLQFVASRPNETLHHQQAASQPVGTGHVGLEDHSSEPLVTSGGISGVHFESPTLP